jgi:hypothetical protein
MNTTLSNIVTLILTLNPEDLQFANEVISENLKIVFKQKKTLEFDWEDDTYVCSKAHIQELQSALYILSETLQGKLENA